MCDLLMIHNRCLQYLEQAFQKFDTCKTAANERDVGWINGIVRVWCLHCAYVIVSNDFSDGS